MHGACICLQRSSACVLRLLVWCFWRTPNSRNMCVSGSFACSWDPFSPIGCLVQTWPEGFALCHCILFGCVWLLSIGGKWGEWVWGRGEVQGSGGRETVIGMCCMREDFVFSKTKQKLSVLRKSERMCVETLALRMQAYGWVRESGAF